MPTEFAWSSQSQWEMAFVYAYITTFQAEAKQFSLHSFPEYQPEDLEHGLQQSSSDLVDQLVCSFLSNALNRKKAVEGSYVRTLQEMINGKIKAYEFDGEINPMADYNNFHDMSPDIKLSLLRWLVEWQLQDCVNIHLAIDSYFKNVKKNQDNPLELEPLGHDSKKRAYYQFGGTLFCWIPLC
ncbi:hypothetical protein BDF14DRAFT_1716658 [Spinellus fusiger]|nr:hypothetical protein BDF14DRAFT_1716658 [Spinellus fusiger]